MKNARRNQKGFAPLELMLLMVIAIVVCVTGYYVWHSTESSSKLLSSSQDSSSATGQTPTVFNFTGGKSYNFTYIAKTPAQQAVALGLQNFCRRGADPTNAATTYAISEDFLAFQNKANSVDVVLSNYAKLNVQCYDTKHPEKGHDGTVMVLKKQNKTWNVLLTSQSTPNCDRVDHLGIPPEIVSLCADSATTTRAPL